MRDPRSVLITGASSGIGAALACAYAGPGRRLVLGGRNHARLEAVREACAQRGAAAVAEAVDVTDRADLAAWIEDAWREQPLDLVIANAGISAGTGEVGTTQGGESAAQAEAIFATNLTAVLDTVHTALRLMQARAPEAGRPRGQIAVMSSLAAFRGFAGAPAYCASKAAVRVYGEALRDAHARDAIEVSVICPGFVRTPMTDVNAFRMPFLMAADRAAAIIKRRLAENRARIAFPRRLYWIIRAVDLGTGALTDRAMRGLPRKPADPGHGAPAGSDSLNSRIRVSPPTPTLPHKGGGSD